MKLNKKQKRIYDWLLSKPGYLKYSPLKLATICSFSNVIDDYKKVLKIANVDYSKAKTDNNNALNQKYHNASISLKDVDILSNMKKYGTMYHPKDVAFKKQVFNKDNVLVIGDTHEPFCKDGYLEHCLKVQKDYNCGTVVHIGDLIDNHCISYHEHDPDGKSPGDEYILALNNCEKWFKAFPDVLICIGNHDRLPFRKAYTAGLPKNWLKSYQEMFKSPKGWKWDFVHKVNGVIYQHGTGMSGEMASINAARENRQSTVIGHLHTVCNTRFLASHKDLIFGMSVGCGIDHTKYAFAYGKENTRKPVLSCGVVLNGKLPINIPMEL